MTPSSASRCRTSVCGSTSPSTERPRKTPATSSPSTAGWPMRCARRAEHLGGAQHHHQQAHKLRNVQMPHHSALSLRMMVYKMMRHYARHVQLCCFFGAYVRLLTCAHFGMRRTARQCALYSAIVDWTRLACARCLTNTGRTWTSSALSSAFCAFGINVLSSALSTRSWYVTS